MWVAGDEEGGGDGGKCEGDEGERRRQGGEGNESGG